MKRSLQNAVKSTQSTEPKLSVEEYAEQIKSNWHQSVKDILATSKICANADGALSDKEKKALLKAIADQMGANEHSMLVQIGGDKRFDNADVQALLPPAYSVMYELHLWENGPFWELINRGGPLPTRAELIRMRKGPPDSSKERYVGRILASGGMADGALKSAIAAVKAAAEQNKLKYVACGELAGKTKDAKKAPAKAAAADGEAPSEAEPATPAVAPAKDAGEASDNPTGAPKQPEKRTPRKAPVKAPIVSASTASRAGKKAAA